LFQIPSKESDPYQLKYARREETIEIRVPSRLSCGPTVSRKAIGIPRFASGFQKKHSALSIQPPALSIQPPEITANYTQAHNDDRWLK